jgi:hypothetical protein
MEDAVELLSLLKHMLEYGALPDNCQVLAIYRWLGVALLAVAPNSS